MSAKILTQNIEEMIQSSVGEIVNSNSSIYFILEDIFVARKQTKTAVVFIGKDQKIHSIDTYDNVEPHQLDEKALSNQALKRNIDHLAIITKFGAVPSKDPIHCTGSYSTSKPDANAINDNERVIASLKLAKSLKEKKYFAI